MQKRIRSVRYYQYAIIKPQQMLKLSMVHVCILMYLFLGEMHVSLNYLTYN